jgi:hypothetical protein
MIASTLRRRRPGRGRRGARWLRGLLLLVASVAVTIGLSDCGAGRGLLGTSSSPCFIALPVAKHAVGGRGSLTGVRLVDPASLTARNEPAMHGLLDKLRVQRGHDVCLVAYTGSFTPRQVQRPVGPHPRSSVRYAIAVVTTAKPRLLGTFVVRREPLDFTHTHLGS